MKNQRSAAPTVQSTNDEVLTLYSLPLYVQCFRGVVDLVGIVVVVIRTEVNEKLEDVYIRLKMNLFYLFLSFAQE